ncbi:MAG: DJ-1/PfpI family protein [Pseudobdellovibrio sp.]
MRKIALLTVGFAPKQTEITEMISALIALSELKVDFKIFALNREIPLNHHTLHPLEDLNAKDFDALILPGGRGIGDTFSSWFQDQIKMTVHPQVEKAILDFYNASSPIGAICLAPILLAKVLGKHNPNITLGEQFEKTEILLKWGASVDPCPSTDFITDRNTKVITTPAYMNEATPFEVYTGIRALVKELVEMA